MVRSERAGDEEGIRSIHRRAFETGAEANLVDSLRECGEQLISLVAEEDGELVGHILFSPISIEGTEREVPMAGPASMVGLAPVAVLPGWQGRGIGARLVEEGLRACGEAGCGAVVVLGHPEYYHRFGFVQALSHGITCEFEAPADAFMVKELKKDALRDVRGRVRYHDAFKAV
jgi:putative acetyltransferase